VHKPNEFASTLKLCLHLVKFGTFEIADIPSKLRLNAVTY